MKHESLLQRGWNDFQSAVKSIWGVVFFLIAPVAAGIIVGQYTQNYWLTVYFLIVTLLLIWIITTATAPYRQRNDERRKRKDLEQQVAILQEKLSGQKKPRKLNREQIAVLTDAIRNAGVRPQKLNVIYAPIEAEVADFATDIGDAIKEADIECSVHNGTLYDHDPRARGIKIIRDKHNKSLVDLGDAIHAQLKEFDLNPTREDSNSKDTIHIYVARQTLE